MLNISNSIYNIRFFDEMASKKTVIHRVNPLAKLIVTLLYSVVVISFEKYNLSGLIPFILYPIITFLLAEVPFLPVLKRLIVAIPFVIGIGILNPVFDTNIYIKISGFGISYGWISFTSLVLKSSLTLLAGLLLIATTKIYEIAWAFRKIGTPRIFVIQFLLIHRYIFVLLEEVLLTVKAYRLRSPFEKGLSLKVGGALLGQILMKAIERANRVYNAMILRGFNGDYFFYQGNKLTVGSATYFFLWNLFIITAKTVNIPQFLGNVLMGVIK